MNTNTQTIQIEALDTLFFRDGKPFSMGEETWADSIFPPPPSVIYGALRTAWASENNIPLKEIEEKTKDLEIHKIYYQFGSDIYFIMPLDLVIEKEPISNEELAKRKNFEYTAYFLNNFIKNELSSFLYKELITFSDNNVQIENVSNGIVHNIDLRSYAIKNSNKIAVIDIKKFIKTENKMGIGRDNQTNNTIEGNLYRVGMNRINDLKINVEFSNLYFKENSILKLGGEAKTAKFRILTNQLEKSKMSFPKTEFSDKKFKIVLTTPAYFENGFLPSWIDKKTFTANFNNFKFKLINCIVGKPILQGGFDLKNSKPKPMVKLVPSGSVYYFESDTEMNPNDIFKIYSISDNSEETNYQKQGFGHFIIAKI